jgi:hypothetical protein
MCPHGRHSFVGSDVTFNLSKIILDSSAQFPIGRTDLRTTPVAQRAFWDTQDLGEFLGADELPATTSVRGFNPARWQVERKDDPRGVDVGRLAAIIPSCSVCPSLKQNRISHVAPCSPLPSFPRAGDVRKFDLFLPPCPTTFRPRNIPAGNIRQRQVDS